MMKKWTMLFAVLLCLMLGHAAAADVTALSVGTLPPIEAKPNQRLALRTGPGTKYTEIFSVSKEAVYDFAIYQKEAGGSATWGFIEFDSGYGRYRAYTGMKRIDTQAELVPGGNKEGVECTIGKGGAALYAGPGKGYAVYSDEAPADLTITVYHEEQGYVLADMMLPKEAKKEDQAKLTRAWIAVGDLRGYDAATRPVKDEKK